MSSMNQPVCHKLASDLIELANANEQATANARRDEMMALLRQMYDCIDDLHANMGSANEDFPDPDRDKAKPATPDSLESGSHSQ